MVKLISFSIFGSNPKYTIGLIRNIELAKKIYTDWVVRVYYNSSVPEAFIETISDTVQLREVQQDFDLPGMMWRFYPNNDPSVSHFIVRDSDSRLSYREKEAVEEWIESGKKFHVLRDHLHHGNNITTYPVMGGMWGMVVDRELNMGYEIENYAKGNNLYKRMIDMNFLRDVIYEKYKNNTMIHSSIAENFEGETVRPFPSPMVDHRFVGEVYDENDNRAEQYKLWIGKDEVR